MIEWGSFDLDSRFGFANVKWTCETGTVHGLVWDSPDGTVIETWCANPKGRGLGQRALKDLQSEVTPPIVVKGVEDQARGFWITMRNRGFVSELRDGDGHLIE